MKQDVFERLKHAQIGEPIHQPLIFAILVILISITLYFIRTRDWSPRPAPDLDM